MRYVVKQVSQYLPPHTGIPTWHIYLSTHHLSQTSDLTQTSWSCVSLNRNHCFTHTCAEVTSDNHLNTEYSTSTFGVHQNICHANTSILSISQQKPIWHKHHNTWQHLKILSISQRHTMFHIFVWYFSILTISQRHAMFHIFLNTYHLKATCDVPDISQYLPSHSDIPCSTYFWILTISQRHTMWDKYLDT